MAKIWVKLMRDEKIKKDLIYETEVVVTRKNFEVVLREICEKLDTPNPLILPGHLRNFDNFNRCVFKASEFVESINFDSMVMELVPEKKKKEYVDYM